MTPLFYLIPVAGVLALIYTFVKSAWITKQDVGSDKMANIAKAISEGAMAFLRAEYKVLAIFVVAVAVLLAIQGASTEGSSALIAVSFVTGALCSALAGFIGMKVATKANVRTANAARTSPVASRTGTAMATKPSTNSSRSKE
jgi:K(+)-stimulated pyrophosphate-energized sodium pump